MQKSVRTEQEENGIKILKAGKPVGQCELDARVLRKETPTIAKREAKTTGFTPQTLQMFRNGR